MVQVQNNANQSPKLSLAQAKSGAKALYLHAASLSGFEVGPDSPERLSELVEQFYSKVTDDKWPEAVASVLKVIACTLIEAQNRPNPKEPLRETDVDNGKKKACPVYPNDKDV
jgi:hypothetical protein